MSRSALFVSVFATCLAVTGAYGDGTFDNLFSSGKYKEAIEYADEKIPAASRDASTWVKIAKANEKLGLTEKALACYMVSWRMNPKDYESLVGAARIYNKLGQPDNAADMAKKALEQNFTAEASREYASACIALGKPAEAKKALEKVIEVDPGDEIANFELGKIYYQDKEYAKAAALLEKSFQRKQNPEVAFMVGKSYREAGSHKKAVDYLNKAVKMKPTMYEASLDLARSYFAMNNYLAAADEYNRVSGKTSFEAADYYNQAMAFQETGKKDAAVEAFRKAASKFGSSKAQESILAHLAVGKADLESKKYSSALGHLKVVANADPKAQIAEDVHFLLAEAYAGAGNTKQAITSLEEVISLDSKNIEAYARLADLYEKNNLKAKAKATYEKMMSLSPNDPNVYLVLGEYNLKAKRYADALDLFVKSNSLSKSGRALEGIAVSAAALNQWDKARDAAESAVRVDASRVEARQILARAYLRSRNYQEAAKHLEVLVAKDPNDKEHWEVLAKCYEKLGKKDKLAQADKKLVELDKKNVESRMRFAKYSLSKNDEETAFALFKELAVLSPKDPEVFRNLAGIAKHKGDKKAAIGYLEKYLALNPKDAEGFRELGDLQYEQKRKDKALEAYETAMKLDPALKGFYKRYAEIVIEKGQQSKVIAALKGVIKSGEADFNTYFTLGEIYQQKKSYSSAKSMYEKALKLEPQNTEALVALADCQYKLGALSEAAINYQQVVLINPKAVEEHKKLGDVYAKQNKEQQAVDAYQKYLAGGGKDDAIAEKVGKYLFEQKKYKEAVEYLTKVSGSAAKDFYHLLMLGESYYHLGKPEKAIDILESLVSRNPKVETLKDILKMLAQCYEKTGNEIKAAGTYDKYVKIRGVHDPDAAFKRAYLREKTNPTTAEKIYQTNIKQYPNDYRNFLQLGLLYSKKKATLSKAARMLEKAAAQADKGDPKVWLEIAKVYGKLGNEEKELEAYQRFVEKDPQNLEANIRIGEILLNKGKVTEGMIYLETANTLSPNNLEIMRLLADGYLETNRTNEAISLLQKAKELKPDDFKVREKLVKVYNKVGDTKKAREEIKELVDKKHDNRYLLLYAKLLLEDRKYRDVAEVVETIRATNPENIEALMILAAAQRGRKKYDEAIETYKEVIYINADYVPAIYERAEVYLQQSKPQWAQKFYERALRTDPKFALAELGLAKVAQLRNDSSRYKQHVKKAYQLDSKNSAIAEEYRKAF